MDVNTAVETQEPSKLWNANFIILLGINVLSYMAFNLVSPLLAEYAMNLGASISMAGVMVGLFAITALFIGPFGGILTDRTNKKYVLIIATFINGIATFGYSLAPNMRVMIFFRMLHGASFSITSASNFAWIADFIPVKKMGEGMGYFGIGQIIATAFGPAIWIMVSSRFGISKTFMFAAVLLIIAAICMNFVSNKNQVSLEILTVKKNRIRLKDIIAFEILRFGPLLGGSIASAFGYNGVFNFSAMLMLCGILGFAIYNKRIGLQFTRCK